MCYRNSNNEVEDSFGAYLVEGAEFTSIEEYPIIKIENISKEPPIKIMPFHKAINYKGSLKDFYICFYERDILFKRVLKNPKKYIKFFRRTAGIIGFDYSIHTDMPLVKQKRFIDENLTLTYYYSSLGIKCIPNIRYGSDETIDEFFEAIPKNTLVAIGTHGFCKTIVQKAELFCAIETIIKKLNPSGIIVVGPLNKEIIRNFSDKCKFYVYKSWMEENRSNIYEQRTK